MDIKKHMKKLLVLSVAAAVAVPFLSCSQNSAKKLIKQGLYKCHERLELAGQRLEKRSYPDAQRILEEIKYQCGGSQLMDTVYYYSALVHFRQKQYDDARHEFEALYRDFPRSSFVEEAHFRIAQMRYMQSSPPRRDQTETKEAMRLFNDYLDLYPKGSYSDSARIFFKLSLNKLAEKEFNNALFYRKQKKHQAALIYYRSVLSDYPDSKFAPESIVGMAEMLITLGRTQDAEEVVGELDASAFDETLRGRIEAVRQRLSGG